MAFHAQKFCELTGMRFDRKSNTCWGKLQGLPVFITNLPRRDSVIFRLIGNRPNALSGTLDSALQSWGQEQTGISALNYKDRCLSAVISLTPRDTENTLAAKAAALTAFAAQNGLHPCCMSCGADNYFYSYLLDNTGITLCEPCRPHLEQKIAEEREKKAQLHPNWGGLILGAVLGAVIVFLLTYFVLKLSFLSLLTGFAGILIGLFLMRNLGKKITPAAACICGILCLAASFSATFVHFADTMAKNNMQNSEKAAEFCETYETMQETVSGLNSEERQALEQISGQSLDMAQYQSNYDTAKLILDSTTVFGCLRNFKALISLELYSDIKPELIKCILFSLLSIIVGTAVTAPSMVREDMGKHTLRVLPV